MFYTNRKNMKRNILAYFEHEVRLKQMCVLQPTACRNRPNSIRMVFYNKISEGNFNIYEENVWSYDKIQLWHPRWRDQRVKFEKPIFFSKTSTNLNFISSFPELVRR